MPGPFDKARGAALWADCSGRLDELDSMMATLARRLAAGGFPEVCVQAALFRYLSKYIGTALPSHIEGVEALVDELQAHVAKRMGADRG